MQKTVLSIIIVNWNTKDLLLECLNSLLGRNSVPGSEIIVVDNASTDGSAEAVAEHYRQVKLIRNNFNIGFGRANNVGIKNSLGRYVCLLNSDVRVLSDCLNNLVEFMDKNTNIGISGPKTVSPDFSIQNTCRKLPTLWTTFCNALFLNKIFSKSNFCSNEHMEFFDHNSVRKVESLAGCCLMIRKAALDQVGFFDEQFFIYFEETDLCKRFGQAGWDIVFFHAASVIHHHGASSAKDPVRFEIEQLKSQMKYWKKHHSKITRAMFRFILFVHYGIRLIQRCIFYTFTTREERMKVDHKISQHFACFKIILSGKY